MPTLPEFAEQLTGSQRDEALAAMRRMLPAIEWKGEGLSGTGLDAARVVYQYAGVFQDHASAIIDAASAVGESTAIVYTPFSLVEKFAVHPTLDTIRIDLALLRDFLIAMDLDSDESRYVEELNDICAEAELLTPTFSSEWIWFSERGSWIFASWDVGDINALAGRRPFLDAYLKSRAQAANEVVEWILGEGSLFSERVTVSDASTFLDRLLRRKTRIEDRFENSSLQRYLNRMHSAETAFELWRTYEAILATESIGDSSRLDPHQRFERYLAERPSVADRLREIWNAG